MVAICFDMNYRQNLISTLVNLLFDQYFLNSPTQSVSNFKHLLGYYDPIHRLSGPGNLPGLQIFDPNVGVATLTSASPSESDGQSLNLLQSLYE